METRPPSAAAVITPNLQRINAALGQENDPLFLAYAVESVLVRASGRGERHQNG